MPTDRFDRGRRTLDDVVTPPARWDEIERRAEAAAEPVIDLDRRRDPLRVRAVAAAVVLLALVVGAVALAVGGGDDVVQTVPADEPSPDAPSEDASPTSELVDTEDASIEVATPCRTGALIEAGDPAVTPGPAPGSFFPGGPDQPDGVGVAHGRDGDASFEVHVPGVVVTDLVGERVEDVELRRGIAQLWLADEFTQLRWFTGGQDRCSSFVVTAWDGTEADQRAVVAILADRIVLPAERTDVAPDDRKPGPGEAFAIWPETDVRDVRSDEPAWSSAPESTALEFAREVLGWDDATVPSDVLIDSFAGTRSVPVARAEHDGPATGTVITVRQVVADRWRVSSVGPLDADDDSYASVSVRRTTVYADAGPSHPGTVTREVQFRYSGVLSVGPAEQDFELAAEPTGAGSVLVLFRDAAGEVIGAWGTTLPAGDFAAG